VGVAAGEPLDVSCFEVAGHFARHWAGAGDVAEKVEVGDCDQQMQAGVVVHGDHASGLELELGDADAIFDEENFLRAALQDVQAAIFVPFGGGVAEFVVLEDFDGEVAEGLVVIVDDVSEVAGSEADLAVLQLDGEGIFAGYGVGDFAGAEHDVDIVVSVTVEQRVGVRGDVDREDADLGVGEDEFVVGLGGDVDFLAGLRGEEGGEEKEEDEAAHGGDCSIGAVELRSTGQPGAYVPTCRSRATARARAKAADRSVRSTQTAPHEPTVRG
jgi:hypothetical protein